MSLRAHARARDDAPCRHSCGHVDCKMDRGEPLPAWVTAYQGGVRYHDAATRARARAEAVRIVDERRGCSLEFSPDPEMHTHDYDDEEVRLLADWDRAGAPT